MSLNYFKDEKIYEVETDINNIEFINFIDLYYKKLKQKHIELGNYTDKDIKNGILYDPGAYLNTYNIFNEYNKNIYKLLLIIKNKLKEACIEYGIDYDAQQYSIHGWLNYLTKDHFQYNNSNGLPWHDHGSRINAFHGYYSVNAEPSITHYKINNILTDRQNKNGRLVLAKTGIPHSVGVWNENNPRITIAYNIVKIDDIINNNINEPFIPFV